MAVSWHEEIGPPRAQAHSGGIVGRTGADDRFASSAVDGN